MGDAVRAITPGPRERRWMRQARVSPRGSFRRHNDMWGAIVGDIAGSVYEWNPIHGSWLFLAWLPRSLPRHVAASAFSSDRRTRCAGAQPRDVIRSHRGGCTRLSCVTRSI